MNEAEKTEKDCLKEASVLDKEQTARPAPQPIEPSLVIKVAMRDNVKLYTEVFLPTKDEKSYPVILMRSPYPYSKPSYSGRTLPRILSAGYAIVFQLTRGQDESEGTFRPYSDEPNDGYDCIEWIAQQPWCNGNVGMQGASYLGGAQLLAAKTYPPALKCIMPTAFIGNFTRTYPFSYGVPHKSAYIHWYLLVDAKTTDELYTFFEMNIHNEPKFAAALHKRPLIEAADKILAGDKLKAYKERISNPLDNEYWQDVHFTDKELANLNIPIFFTDGWYDVTVGPIDYFSRLEKIYASDQDNNKNPDRYLLVGPWDHGQTYAAHEPGTDNGDRVLPDNGAVDLLGLRLAFFDRYLKGIEEIVQEDRVRVYITGATNSNANIWKSFPTFPAPNTNYKCLYLHSQGGAHNIPSDGVLNEKLPDEEPVDTYLYNPSLPTPSMLASSKDQRQNEIRTDVLTYTTKPFIQPLTILGDITLILHAASDALDTDWFVLITEVFPDGQSKLFHYAPPAFRARYRHGFNREVLLTPNKPEEFRISMGTAGHQIAKGNCIRLSIFSSAFPEYDPNSNTGNPIATDTDMKIAKQTIFHDVTRVSHLVLPIINLD